MEILMISDSKLKVMLTAEDLASFSLCAKDLDYSNTETKRMFWDILGRAKKSVGFDTDGHRVLVQLFPSRDGGCEMFITRLGMVCHTECGAEEQDSDLAVISHTTKQTNTSKKYTSPHTVSAFGFDTMERMLTVCRRLSSLSYEGESEAYLGDDRRCYLFLGDVEVSGYLPLDEYSFIGEYGTVENVTALRHFVGEHARAICREDAVACLSRF